jgi:hypothetical protein
LSSASAGPAINSTDAAPATTYFVHESAFM